MNGPREILVACYELALSGGMLRFERFGREISKLGVNLTYMTLGDPINVQMSTEFDVVQFEEGMARTWDVTMVPGQAFPPVFLDKLCALRQPRFGYRVQHVLNDSTHKDGFLKVNRSFLPDLVIFNNRHWLPGSFTDFLARKFMTIEGAVDSKLFSPSPAESSRPMPARIVIGAQAKSRCMVPLLEAVRLLPSAFVLRLFGRDFFGRQPELAAEYQDLIDAGRLVYVGPLHEKELPDFYRACDIVVNVETFAGWANVAAEAMACGLPVVCTHHGTLAFAKHNETAWVVEAPKPMLIATAIRELAKNHQLASRLSVNGRRRISRFTWQRYAKDLLQACIDDERSHYTWAPDKGLYGKWPLADRLTGLEVLLEHCKDLSVLDLGCSEGIVALECLRFGAALVHGFDVERSRVEMARRCCAEFATATFYPADISVWDSFAASFANVLLESYDIVLYLGLHHHLPAANRTRILHQVLRRTRQYFAIRTPAKVFDAECLDRSIQREGFSAWSHVPSAFSAQGELKIYKRKPGATRGRT